MSACALDRTFTARLFYQYKHSDRPITSHNRFSTSQSQSRALITWPGPCTMSIACSSWKSETLWPCITWQLEFPELLSCTSLNRTMLHPDWLSAYHVTKHGRVIGPSADRLWTSTRCTSSEGVRVCHSSYRLQFKKFDRVFVAWCVYWFVVLISTCCKRIYPG